MKKFIFLITLFLASCVMFEETYTQNGEKGYTLDCSEGGWSYCHKKAGELCGERGYKIFDRSSEKESNLVANQYSVYSVNSSDRAMLISCKTEELKKEKNKK